MVKRLGPDNIVDYTSEDVYKQLDQYGKYVNKLREFYIVILISTILHDAYSDRKFENGHRFFNKSGLIF